MKCEITQGERDPSCECMTCREYRNEIRMKKTEKQLYCIAFTYWSKKESRWIGDKNYTHALNIEEARLTFFQSQTTGDLKDKEIRIVGIAPVIGYFVDDKLGQELSV